MTTVPPRLAYSSDEHGVSLTTFYTRAEKFEQSILVVKTDGGEVRMAAQGGIRTCPLPPVLNLSLLSAALRRLLLWVLGREEVQGRPRHEADLLRQRGDVPLQAGGKRCVVKSCQVWQIPEITGRCPFFRRSWRVRQVPLGGIERQGRSRRRRQRRRRRRWTVQGRGARQGTLHVCPARHGRHRRRVSRR